MLKQKVVYYNDEINDDFVDKKCDNIAIDENYKYIHKSVIWRLLSFLLYRMIITPFAYLYMKIKFRLKILGKDKLLNSNGEGYFLYLNHTQKMGDAFLPTLLSFRKKAYVIVHPYNVSIPFWGYFIKFLGPLPLPSNMHAWKNYYDAFRYILAKKQVIAVYPEAHVWDYYTKIRPYKDTSFKYPIKFGIKSYCATVTYKKSKFFNTPKMVVYIDGPFEVSNEMNIKNSKEELRNKIFECMCNRSKESDIQYIKYIKNKEKTDD